MKSALQQLVGHLVQPSQSSFCLHIRADQERAVRLYIVDRSVVGARNLESNAWRFATAPRSILEWVRMAMEADASITLLHHLAPQSIRLTHPMDRIDFATAIILMTGASTEAETNFEGGARVTQAPSLRGLKGPILNVAHAATSGAPIKDLRLAADDESEEIFWGWIVLLQLLGLELSSESGKPSQKNSFWASAETTDEAFEGEDLRSGGKSWTNDHT